MAPLFARLRPDIFFGLSWHLLWRHEAQLNIYHQNSKVATKNVKLHRVQKPAIKT